MKEIVSCENRLKSMIVLDKQDTPQKINKILKAELLFVLKNYFEICAEDLTLDIVVNSSGVYELSVLAKSRRIKIAHTFEK